MAKAFKCDACGIFYEYDQKGWPQLKEGSTCFGVTLQMDSAHHDLDFDLCPACATKICTVLGLPISHEEGE